ncbi:MAG: hypothetical protein ACKPE3_40720, partial [Sphaerospermopsis kisseleviana]
QTIEIGTATIQVEKLDPKVDLLSLNFDEDGNKLPSFQYKWVHLSGFGFMSPSFGQGFTVQECIAQAKQAMGLPTT